MQMYFECYRANKFEKYDMSENEEMPTASQVLDFISGLRQTREEIKMTSESRMTHSEAEVRDSIEALAQKFDEVMIVEKD